jgi:hypothetical protein
MVDSIPIHDPERDNLVKHQFMIARANAIELYASIEQSMASMLAQLLKTDAELAGIVFFRIVNARSRNVIFESLFKKRFGQQYGEYWTSLSKIIRTLDDTRNQIIHWHVAHHLSVSADGVPTSAFALIPPNFWALTETSPQIRIDDLLNFTAKCDFVYRSINMLGLELMGKLDGGTAETWREIFREPAVYPPPDTHPLYRS